VMTRYHYVIPLSKSLTASAPPAAAAQPAAAAPPATERKKD
jgi:hypothetical protein